MEELGIDKLSVEQRLQLLDEICDSIPADRPLPPMTKAQMEELDRRIAAHEADPNRGSSWEDVKARILSRR
jgi:putative addiction module component (TIGR02574 family)